MKCIVLENFITIYNEYSTKKRQFNRLNYITITKKLS